jgi:hypothetical protein
MIEIRRAQDRGGADHGWLKTFHTFSFAEYYDPAQMGFSVLRVINEDRVEGGAGFPTHGHRDMEIITVVLSGALEHRDTLGNHSVIHPGEVQRMSAGTGIRHSEFNHLREETTHFYQIWIQPDKAGHLPGYEQKSFAGELEKKNWVLAASGAGRDGSVKMNQDAELWLGRIQSGAREKRELNPQRKYWLQVISGDLQVNGQRLATTDGLAVSGESALDLTASEDSRVLFFDLP